MENIEKTKKAEKIFAGCTATGGMTTSGWRESFLYAHISVCDKYKENKSSFEAIASNKINYGGNYYPIYKTLFEVVIDHFKNKKGVKKVYGDFTINIKGKEEQIEFVLQEQKINNALQIARQKERLKEIKKILVSAHKETSWEYSQEEEKERTAVMQQFQNLGNYIPQNPHFW